MKSQEKITEKKKLFNPNYTFSGDSSTILKDYPKRSQRLEQYAYSEVNAKDLNSKFVKDGFMYLLRGAKNGQETGFYSQEYAKKNTIESLLLDPNLVAQAQTMNGNTPFISATTDLYTAASFSNFERIYVLKIPVEDVYTFAVFEELVQGLDEKEYMIPDYISQEEIIRSFRYDKFREIYNFLSKEVGLDIEPEDLGIEKDIRRPDMDRIKMAAEFNNSMNYLDPILGVLQDSILSMKLTEDQLEKRQNLVVSQDNQDSKPTNFKNTGRKIAVFTDAHALLEPTEAVLQDIKKRGITEIYSLGDNIGLGPNPSEVVDLLDAYNVVSLQGNYEDMLNFGPEPFSSYLTFDKIMQMEWTKSVLRSEQLEKLKVSPHFIHLQMANQRIALCHFANDVRCDFTFHDSWDYNQLIALNKPAYHQFYYTNSLNQLMEIASCLGIPEDLIFTGTSTTQILNRMREYIKEHQELFHPSKKGYLSYCEDPLFYQDQQLSTIKDYDVLVQGHVHFKSQETDGKTSIYTLRAVGMGYDIDRKDQASYTILEEGKEGVEITTIEVPFDREKMEYSIQCTDVENEDIKRYTFTR